MNTITITIHTDDLDHLRTMCREQYAGDIDLTHDIKAGFEPETRLPDAIERILMVEDVARQIGGLYGAGFAEEYGGGLPD